MTENPIPKTGTGVPTISRILADGRMVELLYIRADGRTRFAVSTAGDVSIVDSVSDHTGETLIPLAASNNLIRHEIVALPEHPVPFGSIAELAAEIGAYIDRYVDLSPGFREVATAYILLSWVYDAFNELPYLRFSGDPGSGKTRALSVIGSLAYKGFFASGASTVSPIFHIIDTFRGTLIFDEADFRFSDEKAELTKILNNGNVNGFPVLRQTINARREFNPRAFTVYGPKIVATRGPFEDRALESRFLTEHMGRRPVRPDIPRNLPQRQKEEARALRNKLLMYRFLQLADTRIDDRQAKAQLSARMNQIVIPLLSVAPSEAARNAIVGFAESMEREHASQLAQSLEATILRVLAGSTLPISVSRIATLCAEQVGVDIERPITPRYVGFLLRKRLRITPVRIGGVFVVPAREHDAIAFLLKRYGIDAEDTVPPSRASGR